MKPFLTAYETVKKVGKRKMLTPNRKREIETTAELFMMRSSLKASMLNNHEVEYIITYLLEVLNKNQLGLAGNVLDAAFKFCKNPKIQYLHVGTVAGFRMLSILMTTDEDEEEFDPFSEYGVFGYVYNIDAPELSELGYTFYEQLYPDQLHRIG